ncbi:MAG: transcription elongation factor GreA [Lachnospiraceae bacterium]|nr:transcription elongation factor GreA [Lachnospiraceae bacterium]MDD5854390.1 transcription elongation factor GreA [Lachnospiraceae bacterium]
MSHELTKQDIEKMQEEIDYRKITVRQELLEHVKTARAHGDLSENFEYKAAKKEKNANESRIRFLERMIKTAVIISDETPDDQIGMNKEVTVEFCDDHSEETYSIVSTMRENSLKGLISIESPVGKALMGHKVGDTVTVVVNDKVSYDVIVKKIDVMKEDVGLNKF